MKRRLTRQISLGQVKIGGGAPISVQSMTKTKTEDIKATIAQIRRLEKAGCEIVRVAVPNYQAAQGLKKIKEKIGLPLVADIHFNYKLALEAIKQGVDGLRINPGNIGDRKKVELIVQAAKSKEIPIRIGVNAASLEKGLLEKYGRPTPEALVESTLAQIEWLESLGFYQIKVSLKSSEVLDTVEAYRLISSKSNYPLHLGITEAGPPFSGGIRSAVGLGILLAEGIGDTIRVSLTADPLEEVKVGYEILKALKLRRRGVEIISCPTCGRCEIDLLPLVKEIEKRLAFLNYPLKVAVMGCAVNGPGEAREADLGIAGGKKGGWLFKKGERIRRVKEKDWVATLVEEAIKTAEI